MVVISDTAEGTADGGGRAPRSAISPFPATLLKPPETTNTTKASGVFLGPIPLIYPLTPRNTLGRRDEPRGPCFTHGTHCWCRLFLGKVAKGYFDRTSTICQDSAISFPISFSFPRSMKPTVCYRCPGPTSSVGRLGRVRLETPGVPMHRSGFAPWI